MLIYIFQGGYQNYSCDILLGNLTTLFALLRSNENEEKLRNMHLHSGFFSGGNIKNKALETSKLHFTTRPKRLSVQ